MSSENPGMMQLHYDPTGAILESALDCEVDVFLQAFGNTREQLVEEYGPYGGQSHFLVVTDNDGYAVGVSRIVFSGPAGLKTLNDMNRDPWNTDGSRGMRALGIDPEKLFDIATLGVRKEYRGASLMVSIALMYGLIAAGTVNGCAGAIAIFDKGIWGLLTAGSMHFHTIPGAFTAPYLGSAESTPVYSHGPDIKARCKKENEWMYQAVYEGSGIDGIIIPAAEAFKNT